MSDDSTVSGWLAAASALVGDVLVAWLLLVATYYAVVVVPTARYRFLVAVPTLLVLPGYVLTAAVFPRAHRAAGRDEERSLPTVTVRERLALSFALSVALVVLLGFLIGVGSRGITPAAVIGTLAAFVGVVGLVAIIRRSGLPARDRFVLPVGTWLAEYRSAFDVRSAGGKLLLVLLGASIVLALSTAVYAVAVPQSAQQYTDFYLATEESSVEYVAAGYPTNLTENQSASLTFGVENHEDRPEEYEVVVTLDRIVGDDEAQRRVERAELARFQRTVDAGVQWTQPHRVQPPMAGENLRLSYYLYRGEAPATPTADTAYRNLHVWTDVRPAVENGTGAASGGPAAGNVATQPSPS